MSATPLRQCGACGADIESEAERCWLCGQSAGVVQPARPRPSARPRPGTFSLAALMLVVTFLCVWLGVTVQWPPVGIGLAVLAAPALARAWWYQRAWRKAGAPMTASQAALSFVGSLMVMTVVVAAAAAAFFTAAFVAFASVCSPLEGTAVGVGLQFAWFWIAGPAAGLLLAGVLLWRLWIRQVWQRRTTGKPLTARQRIGTFSHALLIAAGSLAAAAVGGMPLPTALDSTSIAYADPTADKRVWPLVYFLALVQFVVGGLTAFWISRKSLRLAGLVAACGLGVWIGVAIGTDHFDAAKMRLKDARGMISPGDFALLVTIWLYLLPLATGAIAGAVFFAAERAVFWLRKRFFGVG